MSNSNKTKWVWDIEVFKKFFSVVFVHYKTNEEYDFVVSPYRDNRKELLGFIDEKVDGLIGFNSINYDYPVFHLILTNRDTFLNLPIEQVLDKIYSHGQEIICTEYPSIKKPLIRQLDLFRMHHFNNKAKMCSLKWIQFAMRWKKLQDLPFHYTTEIKEGMIDSVISYNYNDVYSTKEFFNQSKGMIEMRDKMKVTYGINNYNFPDVKIGEEILIKENSNALNIDEWDLRKMRTERPEGVKLKDIILNYISFKSETFNKAFNNFKEKTIFETKNALQYSLLYKGCQYDFGLGGIHGTCGAGVYEADDEYDLILVDVSSYYPNLAIKNGFYPKHLSKIFCDVGEKLYNNRMKAKEVGDHITVGGIKLALNGALFGKSNDKYSPMYDPQFMLSITINGQLLLCMLAEQIADNDMKIVQINTDGILVKLHKNKRKKLDELCDNWMDLTNLKLDYDHFSLVAQRDVNNYLGLFTNGKIKFKGAFEIDKAWHKNHSMRIVPIAVKEYFVNNKSVEDTITQHKDIFDFCIGFKATSGWDVEFHHIVDGNHVINIMQKVNRFFVSKSGGGLYKKNKETGSFISVLAKQSVKMFNDYYDADMKEYNVDYGYYINEANKLIRATENNQTNFLNLFDE